MAALDLLKTSFTSMFPMLSFTSTGALLTYTNTLSKSTNPLLTNTMMNFFAPILNFVYISSSLDLNEFETIWPLIAVPLFMNFILLALCYFLTWLVGYPSSMRNTFTIFLSINNYGLVFTLAGGICSSYGPLSGNEYCSEAFSYVSIYNFTQIFMYWTVAYTIVGRDRRDEIVGLEGEMLETSRPTFCRTIYQNLKTPNPLSCILGVIFAVIPGYKSLLFYSHSPLFSLATVAKDVGFLSIFIAQLVLGSNIYMMVGAKSRLSRKLIVLSILIKTIVIPLVSLMVVYFLWSLGIFGDNKLMAYVIFMSNSCPPAIVSMVFAMIYKMNLDEVIQSMFWIYMVSIFTLACWNFLYFILV